MASFDHEALARVFLNANAVAMRIAAPAGVGVTALRAKWDMVVVVVVVELRCANEQGGRRCDAMRCVRVVGVWKERGT